MFWCRNKTVRVELVNPTVKVQTEGTQLPPNQPPMPSATEPKQADSSDYVFKLLTFIAVVSQGALAIYGYTRLMGYYDFFGITSTELSIGLSTLIFWGYIFFFNETFGALIGDTKATAFIAALIIIGCSWALALLINRRLKINSTENMTFLICLPLLAILVLPAFGAGQGQELARKDFEQRTQTDQDHPLPKETTIRVGGTDKKGMLIVADAVHSFLLACNEVLKIDNKGHVVRTTLLFSEENPGCVAQQKTTTLPARSSIEVHQ